MQQKYDLCLINYRNALKKENIKLHDAKFKQQNYKTLMENDMGGNISKFSYNFLLILKYLMREMMIHQKIASSPKMTKKPQKDKLTIFVLNLLGISISLPTIFPSICFKRCLLSIVKVWLLHILPNSIQIRRTWRFRPNFLVRTAWRFVLKNRNVTLLGV